MKEWRNALLIFVVLSVCTGLAYPLAITALSQVLFPREAGGSLVLAGGKVVGSRLIGQDFTSPRYFHGRPSALEKPYDAGNSGGSNFGPTSRKYLEQVESRVRQVRNENGLAPDATVPADLVLASASGLDPEISLDAALLQVARVAKARGLAEVEVKDLVASIAKGRYSGQVRVNVLKLNMALDNAGADEK
jgi:K+-transporting ATPase ATPase C chain